MRIGLDGIPLAFPKTGVGHYTFELAQALARVAPEHEFEFIYPSTFPLIDSAGNGIEPPLSNLRATRVSVGPVGRHWWSVGLPHYLRHAPSQLFHGTNYDVPLWRRCATVLSIHDLSQLLYPETHERRSVRRAIRRLPLMAKTADSVIVPSETVRREVLLHLRLDSSKVFAVPHAARACFRPEEFGATQQLRRRLGIGDEFILTVGTIEPRKNLSLLLTAFEELIRAQPSETLQLVIAGGRGWLSSPLFDAFEKSAERERIILTDYLHDEDLRALYSSCRVFVYPSLYEGFGFPPLEAMACGACVITSDIPTLVETTGTAARLIDPHNASELALTILEVLTNENERRRLSLAGRQRAAEFSWERTAMKTLEVYREAIRCAKGRQKNRSIQL